MKHFSLAMLVLNQEQPFVSRGFAERLALLVVQEKYPKDMFLASGPGRVVEKADMWAVTFDNGLVDPKDASKMPFVGDKMVSRSLTIFIRKTNGEIVDIS